MALDIAQDIQATARILALKGRLDTDTSADLELTVQDLLAAGDREFVIDLGGVSYVSSAGLRVLLALAKNLQGSRGSMRLCALNASVAQVFDVAGFSRLFAIFPDREAALASLLKSAPVAREPSRAQVVSRLLDVGDWVGASSSNAAAVARDVAQLLGVRPIALAQASKDARTGPVGSTGVIPATVAPAPPAAKTGTLGKLRGLFGKKK